MDKNMMPNKRRDVDGIVTEKEKLIGVGLFVVGIICCIGASVYLARKAGYRHDVIDVVPEYVEETLIK